MLSAEVEAQNSALAAESLSASLLAPSAAPAPPRRALLDIEVRLPPAGCACNR
jgi:hypothetical protein